MSGLSKKQSINYYEESDSENSDSDGDYDDIELFGSNEDDTVDEENEEVDDEIGVDDLDNELDDEAIDIGDHEYNGRDGNAAVLFQVKKKVHKSRFNNGS